MHFGCLLISEDNSEDAIYEEMEKYSETNEDYFELEDYTDEVINKYNTELNKIKKDNGEFSFELKKFLKNALIFRLMQKKNLVMKLKKLNMVKNMDI